MPVALVETLRCIDYSERSRSAFPTKVLPVRPSLACSVLIALAALSSARIAIAQTAQTAPAAPPPPGTPATPAAATDAEPAGYRDAVDSAIAEYEAGRFAESRALFERAHALFPNARALRGMGMTEFELRNYPASIYFLEQALGSPVRPLQNELRTETEKLLARARGFVGRVKFVIDPPDAAVVLNDTRLQLGADRTLNLIVGDYTLHVGAQGYGSESRPLRIAGGEEQTVTVQLPKQLEAPAPALQPVAATAPKADEGSSVFASPWLWAAVGVVVAGAAVGVGFAVAGGEGDRLPAPGGDTGYVLR